jgi:alpha-mannosidase
MTRRVIGVLLLFAGCLAAAVPDSILYVVGNAHIDLAYRWRWNETTNRVAPETFSGVLAMLQEYPDLTYSQSQLALYEAIENTHPILFQQIKQAIQKKQWSVVGGQWAEPDAILPSGESLIRQFLIGMEYAQTHLGVQHVQVAWVPDSFCGQALTLPQIYQGCGIRFYLFGRGAPAGKQIFWWIAPDQSRVLAYHLPVPYGLTEPDISILPPLREWYQQAGIANAMVIFGEGDHGGGPRKPDMDALATLHTHRGMPDIRFTTPEQYFATLLQSRQEWPEFKGEMGLGNGEEGNDPGVWQGSYTSQARIKKRHRDAENNLLVAEKFATIGSMYQRKPLFPRVDFRETWKLLLRNEFHDILPGTSIGDAFDDSQADFDQIDRESRRLLRFGLEVIGSRIDTRGDGIPLVVYNPVSWSRRDVAEASLVFQDSTGSFIIKDSNNQIVPYQALTKSPDGKSHHILFVSPALPSLGYEVLRVFKQANSPRPSLLKVGDHSLENNLYRITWDERGIAGIWDKTKNKDLLAATGNVLQLWEENRSSSWDLGWTGKSLPIAKKASVRIVEQGPVRAVVRWQDGTATSRFTRDLILYEDLDRIDFRMTVDWHEHDQLLKVAFPFRMQRATAVFEQPYGTIARPQDGQDRPAQNWIDLCDDGAGIALLNDGKYGFDVRDNVMRISIVRGARDMDPRMDEGEHSFRYALYPHQADDWLGKVVRAGLAFNQPLVTMQENFHIGTLPNWARKNNYSLEQRKSFFSLAAPNVVITAVKVQQGDWSPANTVVRLFETEGQTADVLVHCPWPPKAVQEINHIEEPLSTGSVRVEADGFRVHVAPHQIISVLLTF